MNLQVRVEQAPPLVVEVGEDAATLVPPGVVEVLVPGPAGPRGEPGPSAPGGGTDAHFVHEQPVAAQIWTVSHNLGKKPAIIVEDSAGTVVVGRYENPDTNTSVLCFSAPFGGRAYFN